MQTDPIGYKDQINLYAYVGNDPVNGVDPMGTEVVWLPADTPEISEQGKAMHDYMMGSATYRSDYEQLENSKSTYYIAVSTQSEDSFNHVTEVITINPTTGLQVNAGLQSPALGGGHEVDHAARADRDPEGYQSDRQVTPTVTESGGEIIISTPVNAEEKRATRAETQMANELGEPSREKYSEGRTVRVSSPTFSCKVTEKSC